jgi:CHASE2 domain-containing sensor protein/class 3 adenylate cyclase
MTEDEEGARATLRVFAIAAIALLGLAFSATPVAQRLDAALLDVQWSLLRKFDPRPSADEIIIVGLDESTIRSLKDPLALWQEPLAKALARIAAARPRAIALDLALPERSFESVRPGLDRMLVASLVAARQNGPFVAVIDIDARTRAARQIYPPYLAVLNDERLSLGMLARDVDGVTRRFSLLVPTEDGGFPTLAGRLCRALSKSCGDGLIHYALGPVYRLVPLQQVVDSGDPLFIQRLFRDRIVMIGETQRYSDRIEVPVNLAGWESGGRTSPGVVVHAQALRTALMGAAPVEAARPFTLVVVTLAAFLFLMRNARLAFVTGLLLALGAVVITTFLLRGGLFLPISAAIFTLGLAWASRTVLDAWQRRHIQARLRTTFAGRVAPAMLRDILRGTLKPAEKAERLELAFVAVGLREPLSTSAPSSPPEETVSILGRLHEIIATAVHRHDGMLDMVAADGAVAVFGAPRRMQNPCAAAAAAVKDILRGVSRLNDERAKDGKPTLDPAMAATFGEAMAGKVAAFGPLHYTVTGAAADEAIRLRDEAGRLGQPFLASAAFRACAGEALSDFQHSGCD